MSRLWCIDRGSGTPVLLVHGFPLDHTMWASQIEVLAPRFRVIAPDLQGFGRSDGPVGDTISMEQFADDLAETLDELSIREPVVFCGLSMGGYIAFQFCQKYASRLRGLILCDTRAAADSPEIAAARRVMAKRVPVEGPGPLVEGMLPRVLCERTFRDRPELVEQLRGVMMHTDPRTIAAASLGMAERPDMTGTLSQIKCPTLVIVGQHDASSTPAEMRGIAEAIPNAKLIEISDAGHISPLENPAAVSAAITGFLDTTATGKATGF